MWNQSFTLYLYVNSWDLNCHSYVVFLQPQPGAFQWTSPPSQSAGITIAGGMTTAKYISRFPYPHSSGISTDGLTPPVHPGYLTLRGMQDPPQQRVQLQNTMPGDLNLQGSAVTYPQGIPRFLPPRDIWNARNPSSWMATANYDVRWSISHWSWPINPYPLDS